MGAVTLLQNWLKLMHLLGARRIIHEVDKDNKKSFEIHCLLGSKVVEEFITGDGNSRLIMEYQFEEEYQ
jgi:hypothetical protein